MRLPAKNTIEPESGSESANSTCVTPIFERLDRDLAFVAVSPAMRRLREQIGQVAQIEVPVLCLGESGTGKEVVARLLHRLSRRGNHVLLKVNCAALPADLLESELFGYEQGAFTGAVRAKPGKFELCQHGTILLDEIGELPLALQAKLLHVLQDGEFTRLGGRARIRADVRVVAATNMDLARALETHQLRQDLYYRLSAVVFHIPPLRERPDDIPVLLDYFLERHAARLGLPRRQLPAAALDFLWRYSWPGNTRELENYAKRFLILGDEVVWQPAESVWQPETNPPGQPPAGCHNAANPQQLRSVKDEAEKAAIRNVLEQTHWNRKEAARLLQVSYKCLLHKIQKFGLAQPRASST